MLSAARLQAARSLRHARSPLQVASSPLHNPANRRLLSSLPATTGGLLRNQSLLQSTRPANAAAQFFIANANNGARSISFARVVPRLFSKFFVLLRLPAMLGGGVVAGVAYVNHQIQQAGNYTLGILQSAGEAVDNAYVVATGKAGEVFGTAKGKAGEFWTELAEKAEGLSEKAEGVNAPEWMQKIMAGLGKGSGESGSEGKGNKDNSEGGAPNPIGGAVTAAAAVLGLSDEDKKGQQAAKDDQMMVLTKKMIEIRNILQKVGQSGSLTLPSIVVIGSQSSGKSSVLEAIVGHEFLPKGSNMVTRRPIELTLVNTPEGSSEYGEFPNLGLGRMSDFTQIQRTLTDLNLAVPAEDCVSDDPIQLTIHSPNVPDLSLIDLPGYIQISGADQPEELKGKIAALCDKYIQAPNVILAISAADVDLANSTALRASRRVDPRGERTIGVITKLDLVDPDRALSILKDKNYPLRLGYVGVVCKVPSTGLFSRNVNITNAIVKNENAYFGQHPQFDTTHDTSLTVGTMSLRKKLMTVLEQTMAASLQSTSDAIHQELEEATYEFKVQYNDRSLTAATYLAESLDAFKHSFKEFTDTFGRPQMKALLKAELDQRVLDLLAQRYWNRPVTENSRPRPDDRALSELPTADPDSAFWHRKLDASTSSLTKLGVGRLATNLVANSLIQHMERLIQESTFKEHPFAKQAIMEATNAILNERYYNTSDQVENCIKPYKFEVDVEEREWNTSREHIQRTLREELKACEESMKALKNNVGNKKLNQVMTFVEKMRAEGNAARENEAREALGFSQQLLSRGREGVFLRDRAELIKMRLAALKSKQCATMTNKYHCPEIFLDVVAEKLTSTSVLFLNVELLSEFYYNFPRELDARLGQGLSEEKVEAFAKEDPKIRKHIELQQRKQLLELALNKMESLMQLESSKLPHGQVKEEKRSRWGRFGF